MTENRRRFSRIRFVTDACLQVNESPYVAHVLDLSLNGALLQVSDVLNLALKSEAVIELKLEGSGIVLWFRGTLAHRKGDRLGYAFTETNLESMSHLRKLLEYNLGDPAQVEREVQALYDKSHQETD